jgi:methylenetetrahydrofolate dehydrogenase (NADP+)/methenyltetrahydrofolate cyclohydrolase
MVRILDGKAIAGQVRLEVAERVGRLREKGIAPKLGILLAGDYAPSRIYVRSKEKACALAGIEVETSRFDTSATFDALRSQVEQWNRDRAVHGMIVQLPLPEGMDETKLLECVDPGKDVDGLTPANLGRLVAGNPWFLPATPAGIIELLVRNGIGISGRRVVIVGRGGLVGKPLVNMLLLRGERADATVTVCHTRTTDLAGACRSAEILVVAAGRARLVTGDMVSEGVVVVDAGTNSVEGKLVGDVDFDSVAPKAKAITPVPGGVGPMTVAMLLSNVVLAAEAQAAKGRT